jgi:Tol biopolymer transport system component
VLRLVSTLAVVSLIAGFSSQLAAAAEPVPTGPRLASVTLRETRGSEKDEDADRSVMALQTFGPGGAQRRQLLAGDLEAKAGVSPQPFHGPRWSADGALIAFGGFSRGGERIYVAGADGTGLHAVPGTRGGSNPVLSPDGHTLAFTRTRYRSYLDLKHITEPGKDRSRFYSSATIWLADLGGGKPRRLTRWRNGLHNEPVSFSPDGATLALTKLDDRLDGPRVVLMRLDSGGSSELVQLAEEPALSPDGTRVAFIGYKDRDVVRAEENQDYTAGELYTINVDGTGLRRLTHSDDLIESSPSWDPSGARIAYVRVRADTSFVPELALLFPVGNSIMQVNADGTCASRLASLGKTAFYGVAWQPGVGREAGPISC